MERASEAEAPRLRLFSHLACPRPLVQSPGPKTEAGTIGFIPEVLLSLGQASELPVLQSICMVLGPAVTGPALFPGLQNADFLRQALGCALRVYTSGSRAQSLVIALGGGGGGSCGTRRTAEVPENGPLWERKESRETLLPTVLCPSEWMGLLLSVWLEML